MSDSTATGLQAAIKAYESGELRQAAVLLREVLNTESGNKVANAYMGLVDHAAGRHESAVTRLEASVQSGATSGYLFMALAISLGALGQDDAAARIYAQALQLQPESAEIHYNFGKCLQDMDKAEEAIPLYVSAIKLRADVVEFHCNLGLAYLETGQLELAISTLRDAISLQPDHLLSHYNLAMSLLTTGQLATGWDEYEWRIQHPDGRVRALPFPTWQGDLLDNRPLLVYAEQGVGDEVMFSTCLPDLLTAYKGVVYLECDPRLAPLFKRTYPQLRVVGNEKLQHTPWQELFPDVGSMVSVASLPRFFRRSEQAFKSTGRHLEQDEVQVEQWRERLDSLGRLPKIGISWRGGLKAKERARRSTQLQDWLPVLNQAATFVNLQYGDCKAELAALEQQSGVLVHQWDDVEPLRDIDNFYALVCSLDLVISIDNATAHIAGTADVPVWNLLPKRTEFRWMRDRADSPWYQSMRLFRCSDDIAWTDLLQQVAAELAVFLSKPQQ